jgi:hypothetical protein
LNLKKKTSALSFGGPNPSNYQNLKPSKALLGKKKLKHGPNLNTSEQVSLPAVRPRLA